MSNLKTFPKQLLKVMLNHLQGKYYRNDKGLCCAKFTDENEEVRKTKRDLQNQASCYSEI